MKVKTFTLIVYRDGSYAEDCRVTEFHGLSRVAVERYLDYFYTQPEVYGHSLSEE